MSDWIHCDFHNHSTNSDGVLSPTELAKAMHASGVSAFSLTDHDTVDGIPEASEAAQSCGISFLPGIELSLSWPQGTFHLLGLGMKDWQEMEAPLQGLQDARKQRNNKIMEALRRHEPSVDPEEIYATIGGNILNRSHIAHYLVRKGICSSYHEAFERYLAVGAPAYVAIEAPDIREGIRWIHRAGGSAFIAHPHTLHLNWDTLKTKCKQWKDLGLDGLEVSHCNILWKDHKRLLKICQQFNFQYSGGSDYHGGSTENLGRGSAAKDIYIPKNFPYLRRYL